MAQFLFELSWSPIRTPTSKVQYGLISAIRSVQEGALLVCVYNTDRQPAFVRFYCSAWRFLWLGQARSGSLARMLELQLVIFGLFKDMTSTQQWAKSGGRYS